MESVFESEKEAIDAVTARLEPFSDLDEEILREFVALVQPFEDNPVLEPRTSGRAQPALVGNIAIRNDQISLMESFLQLAKSGAKIALAIPQLPTTVGLATFVDGLHGFYGLYVEFVSRGFKLSSEELIVINILREIQIGTADDIRERLGRNLDGADLNELLTKFSLDREPLRGFLFKHADGRWEVRGL